MIVVAELPTETTVLKKADLSVVVQTGSRSATQAQVVSSTAIIEGFRSLVTTETTKNIVALGAGPTVVVSIGAAVPSGTVVPIGGGGSGGGSGGSAIPAPSGTLLVLNTLATAGVLVYNLSITLPATSRIILYMNGVIAESIHNGVTITILGYTPGEIASDDELKAYY